MDEIKISGHQLWALTATGTCGTAMIVVSANMARLSKQDAWIAAIAATLIGWLFVEMYLYLGELYPDQTLVGIILSAFGKWTGGIVVISFMFLCFIGVTHLVYFSLSFITTQYLPETPPYSVSILIVIALAAALLYGLEAIVRSAEIYIYVISAVFIVAMLLVIPNIQTENLFPVLEIGIAPVFKGAFYLLSYIAWPTILMNMIYPININDFKEAKKSIISGYLWGSFLVFIAILMAILVLGAGITAGSQYPTYLLAKEINVGMILTRMEGVITGIWITTLFFKALLYFYGIVIGITQLVGLKDYRKIVIPCALIIIVFSNVVYPDYGYLAKFVSTTWVLFMATFAVILPAVLIVVTVIKREIEKASINK